MPFSTDLAQFSADYLRLTHEVAESCENHDLTDSMVIGTSAIVDTEIDGAVGMNSGIFNNPFIIWGKYHIAIEKAYWGARRRKSSNTCVHRMREASGIPANRAGGRSRERVCCPAV